jgi:hypothetical protein
LAPEVEAVRLAVRGQLAGALAVADVSLVEELLDAVVRDPQPGQIRKVRERVRVGEREAAAVRRFRSRTESSAKLSGCAGR